MKKYIQVLCIFGLVFLLLSGLIWQRYRVLVTEHMQDDCAALTNTYSAINHTFRLVSATIATEILNREDILKLVHDIVTTTDEKKRNYSRGLLYRKLSAMYQRLKQHAVRQIFFFYPDNRALLRLHRPQLCDDSLADYRPTVVQANKTHQIVHGYESGVLFHGFRHIYPLTYQCTAIGCVEVSQSFKQICQELRNYAPDSPTEYLFIMLKDDIWGKLTPTAKQLYTTSPISNDYICENTSSRYYDFFGGSAVVSSRARQLQQQIAQRPEVVAGLESQRDFHLLTTFNSQLYAVFFHAIKNFSGKHAAYLISIEPEPYIASLRHSAIIQSLVALLLTCVLAALKIKLMRSQKKNVVMAGFLRRVTDNMGEGLYTTDKDGMVTFINPKAQKILGYTSDELMGKNAHLLFHNKNPQQKQQGNHHDKQHWCKILEKNHHNNHHTYHYTNFVHKNGHTFPVEIMCTPIIKHGTPCGVTSLFRDITRRIEKENKLKATQEKLRKANAVLEQLVKVDGLTKIANRLEFDKTLERLLKIACRHKQPLGMLMIDIDHFKKYNDTYGHQQGDSCLKRIAAIIADSCLRPGDFVARYGGEEFAVLLPDTDDTDAKHVAQRICDRVCKEQIPHITSEYTIVTLSIGSCSLQPDEYTTPQEIINCADRRLYAAKKSGRNRVCSQDGNCNS